MELMLQPTLQVQCDLHAVPRGFERFRAYIAALVGDGDDLELPLVSMNPMGKEHIALLLDTLLAFDAEQVAQAEIQAIAPTFAALPGRLALALVATDDVLGGWTNRYFSETSLRFDLGQLLKRNWAVVPIWSSEQWTPERIRAETRAAVYRSAYARRHGNARTLGERLRQEGLTMRFAGIAPPALDADDLAYSCEVLAHYADSSDYPTIIACLYGDEAAREVGYRALGLSPRAGYTVAYALTAGNLPVAAL